MRVVTEVRIPPSYPILLCTCHGDVGRLEIAQVPSQCRLDFLCVCLAGPSPHARCLLIAFLWILALRHQRTVGEYAVALARMQLTVNLGRPDN